MISKERLERLYAKYNRREFVHPDPVEFLYRYEDLLDREIAAFVGSALAYGRVAQILKSVSSVLERMTPSPSVFLKQSSLETIQKTFPDFKHRFATGRQLSSMLFSIKEVLERHGSLYLCFVSGLNDNRTILPALVSFTESLTACANNPVGHLIPFPNRGSACKRLNLFLRWMVRRDEVDPGGWEDVPASKLIVPVDTHMHRICLLLGMTRRKQADMRTALEITDAFREMVPEDPVRYDFSLTRLGIREDADLAAFLNA
jgi:uncharacterized protein (TIGR02757 family)